MTAVPSPDGPPVARPRRGVVLAAGIGSRLRPITDETPKPLVAVGGRPLVDRALDALAAADVEEAVVTVHYRADQVAAHLADRARPRVRLSREDRLLGAGGGLLHALPLLGDEPFYALDCDALRLDGPVPALDRLARAWDPALMDALVLAMSTAKGIGMADRGDLFVDPLGRARLPAEREIAPFAYASAQILSPGLFEGLGEAEPFPHRVLWERAAERGRLWAVVHDGACLQVLTPESLELALELLDERRARWVEP